MVSGYPGMSTMLAGFDATTYLADWAKATAGSARERATADRLREIGQANQALAQSLVSDVLAIESTNDQIKQQNNRLLPVLKRVTGKDLGAEPDQWKAWWTDQLGYAFQAARSQPNPTFTQFVSALDYISSSCFGAGTMVSTTEGPRKIESIAVGDRVLSQDASTGRLTFESVVGVHRSQPTATLRLDIDGEVVEATGIHRFWKAGKGWTMARDLKAGDRLRAVGDTAVVRAIEPGATQPVYNLDVALNRDFFVGNKGLLVHDFSLVQPVLTPFDGVNP